MAAKFCELCGKKTGLLSRTRFVDGYICSDCLNKEGLYYSTVLEEWAKSHSWKNIDEFKAKKKELEGPHCPYCKSPNIQPMGQHKKVFSVGKAVGGAVLTGGIGALAGFAGKKTKKVDWVCLNCGKSFTM